MSARRDVVLRTEQPARGGTKAEQREVIAVHELTGERLDVIAHVVRGDRKHRDRDLRERRRGLALEVDVVGIGERRVREVGLFLVDLGDLLRMRDRRAPEENRVHQAEDRRVGADAERQRQERDEGEARPLARASNGEADVVEDGMHERFSGIWGPATITEPSRSRFQDAVELLLSSRATARTSWMSCARVASAPTRLRRRNTPRRAPSRQEEVAQCHEGFRSRQDAARSRVSRPVDDHELHARPERHERFQPAPLRVVASHERERRHRDGRGRGRSERLACPGARGRREREAILRGVRQAACAEGAERVLRRLRCGRSESSD